MCIVYFCQSEIVDPNSYHLVLVNNRDEEWTRPTKDADFWGPQLDCISGLDMYSGKEGGTWLGMNKHGKIGVLLNILGQVDPSKKGRGFLVSDYLRDNLEMEEYAASMLKQRHDYNGFNLLLFDLGKQEDCLTAKPLYITNASDYHSCVNMRTLPSNTFFGVSNSPLEYPFQKVIKGKQRFGQIVSQYPTVDLKEHLVKDLMELMADKTSLLPDPVMEKAASLRGVNPAYTSCRSAINTFSPNENYGSRTTTVILVDGKGAVDYIERTVEPLQPTPNERTVHKTFNLTLPKRGQHCL
ncbi:transport and Golgi organization 2 homolog [Plakobranchus ocellatus]|uniref:Transport and Golgi organization 2 homolog n=1 Tax=Plakobranchus ocellatus TaxID=259542 RepID=A0AAV4C8B7_9GAST|nr:transport and Golgi organization 2 homolog [Plakobranchus ocellatus]